jgi:hypothetical protein
MHRTDLKHLRFCAKEDPQCDHVSHLLPPLPLDLKTGHCCAMQCFRLPSDRAYTECRSVHIKVRERRIAEELASGRIAREDKVRVTRRNYLPKDFGGLGTSDT